MTKNFAYVRVSTAQQDVRSQRLAILEYAREQGFQIDRFIEAKASGRATKKHRRLERLMGEPPPVPGAPLARFEPPCEKRSPSPSISKRGWFRLVTWAQWSFGASGPASPWQPVEFQRWRPASPWPSLSPWQPVWLSRRRPASFCRSKVSFQIPEPRLCFRISKSPSGLCTRSHPATARLPPRRPKPSFETPRGMPRPRVRASACRRVRSWLPACRSSMPIHG